MLDLWIMLIPILLADVVNPVLFAFMVYAVGTDRPVVNSMSTLAGHTAAYLTFGIVLALGFNAITARLKNPEPIDYGLGFLIGMLLLWVAWRSRTEGRQRRSETHTEQLTPLKAFGIGAIINIVGLPFALPYFAALDQILKADLNTMQSALVLAAYNTGYALPFLAVPVLALVMGERSRPVLTRINTRVDRVSAYLMPIMLALVGVAMIVDTVLYASTGKGLF